MTWFTLKLLTNLVWFWQLQLIMKLFWKTWCRTNLNNFGNKEILTLMATSILKILTCQELWRLFHQVPWKSEVIWMSNECLCTSIVLIYVSVYEYDNKFLNIHILTYRSSSCLCVERWGVHWNWSWRSNRVWASPKATLQAGANCKYIFIHSMYYESMCRGPLSENTHVGTGPLY